MQPSACSTVTTCSTRRSRRGVGIEEIIEEPVQAVPGCQFPEAFPTPDPPLIGLEELAQQRKKGLVSQVKAERVPDQGAL